MIMDWFGVCGGKDMTTHRDMEYFSSHAREIQRILLTGDHNFHILNIKIGYFAILHHTFQSQ